ncbi:YARHG domain-containing protein [Lentilitoribacter sp. Alg239-R112]|uniref:YARHG domain-containing protein n=1 Tax=Lentilitoribacter sp. Alg239-R112 TaxID=2305987 RepID=UPI0013A6A53D|nr:YARHG domain-containing protein [Lentilitoribacter sp. Alg239-R112]
MTSIMRERGFKSDEQLARRAMQIQQQQTQRVNVQRRTINNWRNDKSTPRDISDQQFQLVAQALKLSDEEIQTIENLVNDQSLSQNRQGTIEPQPVKLTQMINTKYWFIGGGLVLLLFASLIYLTTYNIQKITYFDQIPPTQLRLSEDGFVLPNTHAEVVSERQLENLSGWELYVARNEIFARKGRPFVKVSSMCLQRHFDSWSKSEQNPNGWYNKKSGDVRLTDLEYRNAEIIRNYECKVRGGQYNCSGMLNQCY